MTYSPDVNEVTNTDATNAGIYLMFNILSAIGSLASLLVLVLVMAVIFGKLGLGKILKL